MTASGAQGADVLVDGETIVEVGLGSRGGGPMLGSSGLLVLPGLLEPHTHRLLHTVGNSDFGRFGPCKGFDPAVWL